MPFPVALGLPWLLAAISGILISVVTLLAELLTKRLLIIAAVIGALALLTVAFFAAIVGAVGSLNAVAPPQLAQAMGLVYPANLPIIVSVTFTARVARWAYEWNVKVLQFRL